MSIAANLFKKSAAPLLPNKAASSSSTDVDKKPKFLSFLKDTRPESENEKPDYRIASFGEGEHTIRLVPASQDGAKEVQEVIVLPITHKGVEGKIFVGTSPEDPRGDWFFKKVQPFLLKNCRERFRSMKNPTGDVKLRTQKRVIFFATKVWHPDPKNQPDAYEIQLILCNLAGTNYDGAKVGDGAAFLAEDELKPDFCPTTGRRLKIKVSGDTRTRTMKITPDRVACPITDETIAALPKKNGEPYVPNLESCVEIPSKELILECLKQTLPSDVFGRLIEEGTI